MQSLLEDFASDESGATAIEYGLIAALIGLVVIGAMTNVSNVLWNKLNTVATAIK
jgi:pilus assembly protein Flp/PilA